MMAASAANGTTKLHNSHSHSCSLNDLGGAGSRVRRPSEPSDLADSRDGDEGDSPYADGESVVEREIREQRERESALAKERAFALRNVNNTNTPRRPACRPAVDENQRPLSPSSSPAAEARIALELQEMRRREEELRQMRLQAPRVQQAKGMNGDHDEVFLGVAASAATENGRPATRPKESAAVAAIAAEDTRAPPPPPPPGPNRLHDGTSGRRTASYEPVDEAFSHRRAQSFDSMCSGSGSGSGSGSASGLSPQADSPTGRGARRVVVKPLEEPDEEAPAYARRWKETPIEREIRMAREREEELRRDKGLPALPASEQLSPVDKQEVRKIVGRNVTIYPHDSRSVQHRLASSRIQQEINEVTEREKELHAAGMIQTMSEDTVDSKVTRFTDLIEHLVEEKDRKLRKSLSVTSLPAECENGNVKVYSPPSLQKHSLPHQQSFQNLSGPKVNNTGNSSPRKASRYAPQKGLMERFLASHGKVSTLPLHRAGNGTSSPMQATSVSPVVVKRSVDRSPVEYCYPENDSSRMAVRRGYQSAEEKIQVELQEMQKREEELRMQRTRSLAQSQPNLACLRDRDGESIETHREIDRSSTLRSSQSNPNLFDCEESQVSREECDSGVQKQLHGHARKKSALIAQWESIIQQNIYQ